MSDIVFKIRELMLQQGIKQKELVEYLGENQGTIGKWLSEKEKNRRDLPNTILIKIAKKLGVTPQYLLGMEEFSLIDVKQIPIIGTTSCGDMDTNQLQEENKTAYYRGDFWSEKLYALVACGDSMSPEIESGDEIICDPEIAPQNGDIVHYKIGSESAVKVYYEDSEANIIQFVPYNSTDDFKTRTVRIDNEEYNFLEIAKVVAINKMTFNNRRARLRMIGRG